jgi:RsiW-degrading membrane proteinase PrsW (M82 family)
VHIDAAAMLGVTGFILGCALFWLQYFDLKDAIAPEPRTRLVMAFVLGIAAGLMAFGVYGVAPLLGLPTDPGDTPREAALYCFGVVGPLEEGMKFLVARVVVFRWKHFDEPVDGIVYGCAVALGFAALENFVFIPTLPLVEQLARAVASPLTHSLWAAIWGIGCSRALLGRRGPAYRIAWQTGTLALSMALHGLYDYVIVAHGATLVASAIALVVWAYVIWHARRVVKAQRAAARGGDRATSDRSGPRR